MILLTSPEVCLCPVYPGLFRLEFTLGIPDTLAQNRADLECYPGKLHGYFLEFLLVKNEKPAGFNRSDSGGSGVVIDQ